MTCIVGFTDKKNNVTDSFKLYKNNECSDDDSCDCDEEGM